jgi:hypothetical protein
MLPTAPISLLFHYGNQMDGFPLAIIFNKPRDHKHLDTVMI